MGSQIWDTINLCYHSSYLSRRMADDVTAAMNRMQRANEAKYDTPPLWSGKYEDGRYYRFEQYCLAAGKFVW